MRIFRYGMLSIGEFERALIAFWNAVMHFSLSEFVLAIKIKLCRKVNTIIIIFYIKNLSQENFVVILQRQSIRFHAPLDVALEDHSFFPKRLMVNLYGQSKGKREGKKDKKKKRSH
jgi:hypothetical protein